MGFLSRLFGKAVPNAPEMFGNVYRRSHARLSGSTPGPVVVSAGMGNYFEAMRQKCDRTYFAEESEQATIRFKRLCLTRVK